MSFVSRMSLLLVIFGVLNSVHVEASIWQSESQNDSNQRGVYDRETIYGYTRTGQIPWPGARAALVSTQSSTQKKSPIAVPPHSVPSTTPFHFLVSSFEQCAAHGGDPHSQNTDSRITTHRNVFAPPATPPSTITDVHSNNPPGSRFQSPVFPLSVVFPTDSVSTTDSSMERQNYLGKPFGGSLGACSEKRRPENFGSNRPEKSPSSSRVPDRFERIKPMDPGLRSDDGSKTFGGIQTDRKSDLRSALKPDSSNRIERIEYVDARHVEHIDVNNLAQEITAGPKSLNFVSLRDKIERRRKQHQGGEMKQAFSVAAWALQHEEQEHEKRHQELHGSQNPSPQDAARAEFISRRLSDLQHEHLQQEKPRQGDLHENLQAHLDYQDLVVEAQWHQHHPEEATGDQKWREEEWREGMKHRIYAISSDMQHRTSGDMQRRTSGDMQHRSSVGTSGDIEMGDTRMDGGMDQSDLGNGTDSLNRKSGDPRQQFRDQRRDQQHSKSSDLRQKFQDKWKRSHPSLSGGERSRDASPGGPHVGAYDRPTRRDGDFRETVHSGHTLSSAVTDTRSSQNSRCPVGSRSPNGHGSRSPVVPRSPDLSPSFRSPRASCSHLSDGPRSPDLSPSSRSPRVLCSHLSHGQSRSYKPGMKLDVDALRSEIQRRRNTERRSGTSSSRTPDVEMGDRDAPSSTSSNFRRTCDRSTRRSPVETMADRIKEQYYHQAAERIEKMQSHCDENRVGSPLVENYHQSRDGGISFGSNPPYIRESLARSPPHSSPSSALPSTPDSPAGSSRRKHQIFQDALGTPLAWTKVFFKKNSPPPVSSHQSSKPSSQGAEDASSDDSQGSKASGLSQFSSGSSQASGHGCSLESGMTHAVSVQSSVSQWSAKSGGAASQRSGTSADFEKLSFPGSMKRVSGFTLVSCDPDRNHPRTSSSYRDKSESPDSAPSGFLDDNVSEIKYEIIEFDPSQGTEEEYRQKLILREAIENERQILTTELHRKRQNPEAIQKLKEKTHWLVRRAAETGAETGLVLSPESGHLVESGTDHQDNDYRSRDWNESAKNVAKSRLMTPRMGRIPNMEGTDSKSITSAEQHAGAPLNILVPIPQKNSTASQTQQSEIESQAQQLERTQTEQSDGTQAGRLARPQAEEQSERTQADRLERTLAEPVLPPSFFGNTMLELDATDIQYLVDFSIEDLGNYQAKTKTLFEMAATYMKTVVQRVSGNHPFLTYEFLTRSVPKKEMDQIDIDIYRTRIKILGYNKDDDEGAPPTSSGGASGSSSGTSGSNGGESELRGGTSGSNGFASDRGGRNGSAKPKKEIEPLENRRIILSRAPEIKNRYMILRRVLYGYAGLRNVLSIYSIIGYTQGMNLFLLLLIFSVRLEEEQYLWLYLFFLLRIPKTALHSISAKHFRQEPEVAQHDDLKMAQISFQSVLNNHADATKTSNKTSSSHLLPQNAGYPLVGAGPPILGSQPEYAFETRRRNAIVSSANQERDTESSSSFSSAGHNIPKFSSPGYSPRHSSLLTGSVGAVPGHPTSREASVPMGKSEHGSPNQAIPHKAVMSSGWATKHNDHGAPPGTLMPPPSSALMTGMIVKGSTKISPPKTESIFGLGMQRVWDLNGDAVNTLRSFNTWRHTVYKILFDSDNAKSPKNGPKDSNASGKRSGSVSNPRTSGHANPDWSSVPRTPRLGSKGFARTQSAPVRSFPTLGADGSVVTPASGPIVGPSGTPSFPSRMVAAETIAHTALTHNATVSNVPPHLQQFANNFYTPPDAHSAAQSRYAQRGQFYTSAVNEVRVDPDVQRGQLYTSAVKETSGSSVASNAALVPRAVIESQIPTSQMPTSAQRTYNLKSRVFGNNNSRPEPRVIGNSQSVIGKHMGQGVPQAGITQTFRRDPRLVGSLDVVGNPVSVRVGAPSPYQVGMSTTPQPIERMDIDGVTHTPRRLSDGTIQTGIVRHNPGGLTRNTTMSSSMETRIGTQVGYFPVDVRQEATAHINEILQQQHPPIPTFGAIPSPIRPNNVTVALQQQQLRPLDPLQQKQRSPLKQRGPLESKRLDQEARRLDQKTVLLPKYVSVNKQKLMDSLRTGLIEGQDSIEGMLMFGFISTCYLSGFTTCLPANILRYVYAEIIAIDLNLATQSIQEPFDTMSFHHALNELSSHNASSSLNGPLIDFPKNRFPNGLNGLSNGSPKSTKPFLFPHSLSSIASSLPPSLLVERLFLTLGLHLYLLLTEAVENGLNPEVDIPGRSPRTCRIPANFAKEENKDGIDSPRLELGHEGGLQESDHHGRVVQKTGIEKSGEFGTDFIYSVLKNPYEVYFRQQCGRVERDYQFVRATQDDIVVGHEDETNATNGTMPIIMGIVYEHHGETMQDVVEDDNNREDENDTTNDIRYTSDSGRKETKERFLHCEPPDILNTDRNLINWSQFLLDVLADIRGQGQHSKVIDAMLEKIYVESMRDPDNPDNVRLLDGGLAGAPQPTTGTDTPGTPGTPGTPQLIARTILQGFGKIGASLWG